VSGLHWHEQAELGALNTLRLPCRARVLAEAADEAAILEAFARADALELPVYVLGGGSNVVLPPRIEGVVLRLAEAEVPGALEAGAVMIAAGCDWDGLVRRATAAGLWGIENLALIPGRVGAAPVQNIGAYGQELADCCVAVRAFDRQAGRFETMAAEDCGFAYRDSRFKREPGRWLITSVTLELASQGVPRLDYPTLREAVADEAAPTTPAAMAALVTRVRRERLPDPADAPNAGSFFENPVLDEQAAERLLASYPACPLRSAGNGMKVPAAWLIEQAGWRGRRMGAVGISERHALVLVHHGGGDGRDLLAVAEAIERDVHARFGIRLAREPVLLGW
jgi:UDP-N-acetylmuramate dehydrogenase